MMNLTTTALEVASEKIANFETNQGFDRVSAFSVHSFVDNPHTARLLIDPVAVKANADMVARAANTIISNRRLGRLNR